MHIRQTARVVPALATILLFSACGPEEGARGAESDVAAAGDADVSDAAHVRGHIAGMAAHHICAGVFVVGRDYERPVEEVVAQDIRRFDHFKWQDDFEYAVNFETHTASVSAEDFGTRSARYNGDQGCTVLPAGFDNVAFEPVEVERLSPDPAVTAWPDRQRRRVPRPPAAGGRHGRPRGRPRLDDGPDRAQHPRARRGLRRQDRGRALRARLHAQYAPALVVPGQEHREHARRRGDPGRPSRRRAR